MAHAIGIDLGTTNTKAALVGDDGRLVSSASRPIPTTRSGEVAEQDAEQIWTAVVDTVREAVAGATSEAADVVAIGVCSQYSSIVPVDAAVRPVAPMAIWQDKRGTAHSWEILGQDGAFELWIERHGIPPVGNGLSLAHLLHFQHDRPDVHERTATYLEPMDYLTGRMTGRAVANQVTMLTAQLCDNRTLGVTVYDDELVRRAGIDPSRLPALIGFDDPVGTLTGAVADDLGLPASVVVHAGMNDTVADVLATGALGPGRGGLAIGTTSVIVDRADDHGVDLDHEVLAMPSPFGTRLVWAENGIGGRALEFVLDSLIHADDELADHSSEDVFARLEEVLDAVPPGANGVLFLPWLNGTLSPSANASMRGGFLNLGLETSRTDLVRAAAEGVAHNLGWLLPHVERFTGNAIDEIAFVGGAARSEGWCRILADVLDRPVLAVADPDLAIARAMALHGLERSGKLERDDLQQLVVVAGRYDPEPQHRQAYALAHRHFVGAFDALRPIYEDLNP